MKTEFVVLSDIHGNYPSLQAVVDKEGRDEEYIVLGDIIGLNAYPKETVELVQEIGNFVLVGNHDKGVFEHGKGQVVSDELSKFELYHTLSNLSTEQVEWMLDRQYIAVVQRGDSRICLTHAYPWTGQATGMEPGNAGVRKRDVIEVASVVEDDYDYVFQGHTHNQYEQDCSKFGHDVHFVNPGSLGYDGNYAVVDTETGEVDLKHVEYDEDAVKEHIKSVLPEDCPPVERWF